MRWRHTPSLAKKPTEVIRTAEPAAFGDGVEFLVSRSQLPCRKSQAKVRQVGRWRHTRCGLKLACQMLAAAIEHCRKPLDIESHITGVLFDCRRREANAR